MSAKPHTFGDLADDMSERLVKLSYLTQLCAFAAEAQRTLHEIHEAATIIPDLEILLDRNIVARNEWTQHQNNLGVVLKYIAKDIDDMNDLVNDSEVHDAINCP